MALCQALCGGGLAEQPKWFFYTSFHLALVSKKGFNLQRKDAWKKRGPKNESVQYCVWLRAFSYREALPQPELSKAAARNSNWTARLLAFWPYVGDEAFWCWFVLVLLDALNRKKANANKKPPSSYPKLDTLKGRFLLLSKLSWGCLLPGCPCGFAVPVLGWQRWWALGFQPLWLAWSITW